MGMPAAVFTEWTAEMARALPGDGNRYEVLDGELFVTPPPELQHQAAAVSLARPLMDYLDRVRGGHLFLGPGEVEFSPRRWVEPDLFVLPLTNGKRPRTWKEARRPLLVVEILSPSTACADRVRKRAIYQSEGIPEYWIVDLDARLIERWRPGDARAELFTEAIEWRPDPAHDPLVIDLPAYFANVVDE